jgi:hypothetical protein
MAAHPQSNLLLQPGNFERGFLVDDQWMAGISRETDGFLAYVVDHREGGLIARQTFSKLDDALAALNRLPRSWRFETTSGCSGERCGEGKCKGSSCRIYRGPEKASGECAEC